MHEMSYMLRLVSLAQQTAREQQIDTIKTMVVEVGGMTGVLPYYLHKYFPTAVKGTLLEGATLEIIEIPVRTRCEDCATEYEPDKGNGYCCPHCGSKNGTVIAGRDVTLSKIIGGSL
ncbi:MAG: hydrogenase maturation nickel metallochaperone HypA [Lachnospiraceae bacterium]|nr:hydrogenase maturation nickel metallochaperone HypA [Lachnospiraceae bacterium]